MMGSGVSVRPASYRLRAGSRERPVGDAWSGGRAGKGARALIAGVRVKQLRAHADERGYLMEILREDDDLFEHFGQVYVSLNYPGVIRAWHYHLKQTDYFVCLKG